MRSYCPILVVLLLSAALPAAIITNTQGTQNFTDGSQLEPTLDYFAGNTDANAPFDNAEYGFDADDTDSGFNFDVTWAHNYSVITDPILGAVLRIGLLEHESAEAGSQLFSLTLNNLFGATLTALLDAQMESYGGSTAYDTDLLPVTSEYNVYSVTLPAAVFAELASGSVQVRLQLQGPGINIFGLTQNNGAFIDFAEFEITTQDQPTEIPEPASLMLAGAALAAFAVLRRR